MKALFAFYIVAPLAVLAVPHPQEAAPPPPIAEIDDSSGTIAKLKGSDANRDWTVTVGSSNEVTYVYSCGSKQGKQFDQLVCADLVDYVPTPCTENEGSPFIESSTGLCPKKLGITAEVFWSKTMKVQNIAPKTYSDACGWLGGRCGTSFPGATVVILPGSGYTPENKFKGNVAIDSLGAVTLLKR